MSTAAKYSKPCTCPGAATGEHYNECDGIGWPLVIQHADTRDVQIVAYGGSLLCESPTHHQGRPIKGAILDLPE